MKAFKITFLVDGRKQTPYKVGTPSELLDELKAVFGGDCQEWLNFVQRWAENAKPGDSINDDEDIHIACVKAPNVSKR